MRYLALAAAAALLAAPIAASAQSVHSMVAEGGPADVQNGSDRGRPMTQVLVSGDSLAQPPKGKIVCRTYEDTGTRLGQNRRCLTVDEWAHRDAQFNADMQHDLNNRIGPGHTG